jgi:hypothetical protein
MAKQPDLDALIVPKGTEPPSPATAADSGAKGYAHTQSLRLTSDGYRSLRRYVAEQEEKAGKRITHQSLIENLLLTFLADHTIRVDALMYSNASFPCIYCIHPVRGGIAW